MLKMSQAMETLKVFFPDSNPCFWNTFPYHWKGWTLPFVSLVFDYLLFILPWDASFRGFKSVLILFEIDNICSSGALPFSSALLPLRLCADDELCKTHFVLYSVKWITRSIGEKAVPVLGLWGLIEFVRDWMPFCSAVVGSYAWTCRTMLWTFPHGKVCAFSHTRYMY